MRSSPATLSPPGSWRGAMPYRRARCWCCSVMPR
jgi:hypothetical protein